ncbi:DNA polymerase III, subunit gamma and tau [Candidatus Saccharibacteria bacterium RIFCSPHIGHO2_12_FULL_49_19]|nr:MAG: DNA polymerase III, subunit gamma and tau [Candidatus Saccharibacteria bacterium RIFCSPHIGHO2_01_FULL_49_21]OGL37012.1 MAG: DNA polymerase III, subunit gamma and tau [Candidatus Saccharibacteria bacterium RIFCSPHIGHO2_12_FULL_49_19]OGL38549.1 MAG: DNA polymerase III, subunit gamma and tau [Candidatus Saccharibacteria bacterium RIFCSPLOWO2_01_FULL_49_22]
MGQALYRKYRSHSLDEVVGQDHIVETLKQALSSGRLSHAYLFSGPKGVGKTSVARILAHEVNQLPYKDETIHLDIVEIDGASNRRIDEIRDLRERVNIAPTSAKYKVYIIDEVHMLTKEAFNALLKTLEEPPAHCLFILATTEAHKLPETIISRTQRFNFKPISKSSLTSHLGKIAKKEKIDIKPEALDLLAEHGEGSFRDGISLLDQLAGLQKLISTEDVQSLLGLPPEQLVGEIINDLRTAGSKSLIDRLEQAREQAINPAALAASIGKHLRQDLASGSAQPWHSRLLRNLLEVAPSSNPYDVLEISLLETTNRPGQPAANSDIQQDSAGQTNEPPAKKPEARESSRPAIDKNSLPQKFDLANWPSVIDLVKDKAASLYTALRLAAPDLSGNRLTLRFQFPLHQKKINSPSAKNLVGSIIEDAFGVRLVIEAVVDKSAPRHPVKAVSPSENGQGDELQSISNIFGAAEVLES